MPSIPKMFRCADFENGVHGLYARPKNFNPTNCLFIFTSSSPRKRESHQSYVSVQQPNLLLVVRKLDYTMEAFVGNPEGFSMRAAARRLLLDRCRPTVSIKGTPSILV
jgi:hypothetical protein